MKIYLATHFDMGIFMSAQHVHVKLREEYDV